MFSKVLVANRGEIAIRAFRAAYEMGARTVAVFPYEDRWSEHRLRADEAHEIGERGHPVRSYLDPEAIVEVAVRAGADAVYPGYGFLSENPALAEACVNRGITFVGPPATVLELTGNKARAIAAARAGRRSDPRRRGTVDGRRRAGRGGLCAALPGVRQGGRRRRRPRHAARGPFDKLRDHDRAEAAGGARGLHARGRGGVRRPDRLRGAGRRRPAGTSRSRSWPTTPTVTRA